jgi:hypothetical protein
VTLGGDEGAIDVRATRLFPFADRREFLFARFPINNGSAPDREEHRIIRTRSPMLFVVRVCVGSPHRHGESLPRQGGSRQPERS